LSYCNAGEVSGEVPFLPFLPLNVSGERADNVLKGKMTMDENDCVLIDEQYTNIYTSPMDSCLLMKRCLYGI